MSLERLPSGPFSLRVADDGIGIGPDRIGHVFDRFYRAHDQQRLSGLGLYIAREIAERLGGGIQVSSVVGEGTEFTVTPPATPPVSMEPPGHAEDPTGPGARGPAAGCSSSTMNPTSVCSWRRSFGTPGRSP